MGSAPPGTRMLAATGPPTRDPRAEAGAVGTSAAAATASTLVTLRVFAEAPERRDRDVFAFAFAYADGIRKGQLARTLR